MSFSFSQIATALSQARIRLTAENLGYLVLAAADTRRRSDLLALDAICLEPSGSVTLHPTASGVPPFVLLPRLLAGLLERCTTENLALEALATGVCTDDLELCERLEAALVPLNRGAARRALVRLHRELEALGGELSEVPQDELLGPEPMLPVPLSKAKLELGVSTEPTPVLGSPVTPLPSDLSAEETPLALPAFVSHRTADLPPSPYLEEHVPLRSDIEELLLAEEPAERVSAA